MKFNIEVDFEDIFDTFDIEEEVTATIYNEVIAKVKKDPRYKAHVQREATKILEGLTK